jgi:hypothetical protein
MQDRFIYSHLRALPLFERLPDEQLRHIVNAVQVLRFEPGDVVWEQGSPVQGLVYFVTGRGLLTQRGADGVEHRIGMVEPGGLFGEAALSQEMIETATLRVLETAIVLLLTRQRWIGVMAHQPEIRTNWGIQNNAPPPLTKSLFKGQRPNESVLEIFRRHWWVLVQQLWLPALITVILLGIAIALFSTSPAISLALGGLAVVISGIIMIYNYFEWQDDAIIVTDQRVIRISNQLLQLQNNISEIPLESVHEISAEIPPTDVAARLFNYGTVLIKTPGEAGNMTLTMVPNPSQLPPLIFANRDRFRQQAVEQHRSAIRAEIDQAISLNPLPAEGNAASNRNAASAPPERGPLRTRFYNTNGETVYRKHIAIWVHHIIMPTLLFFAGWIVAALGLFLPALEGYGALAFLAGLGMIGVGVIGVYLGDWDWRNDLLVIGENTVTIIRKRPLWLQNEVDQVRLGQVDNVVSDVNGLINTLLDLGDVKLSLIGADAPKIFQGARNPQEIQSEISRRLANMKAQGQQQAAQRQRAEIAEYLKVYHEMIQQQQAQTGARPAVSTPPVPGPNYPPQPGYTPQPLAAQPPPAYPPQYPTQATTPPESNDPPPQPVRDAIRPPRIPRPRPSSLPD